jgi:hypothetical protein
MYFDKSIFYQYLQTYQTNNSYIVH